MLGERYSTVEHIPPSTFPQPISLPRDQALWTELMQRIAQGDESALGELYDRTSPIVFGLILRIVGDRETAEEVTLDVFTQVWKQACQYDPQRGTPVTWLMVLARSRALDRLRWRGSRERDGEQSLEAAAEFTDPAPNPEEDSMDGERSHVVQTALASLVQEQRQAIELAFFGGLSHSEIAIRLALPLGTVKTHIRLGMVQLRDCLRPYADSI